MGGDTSPCSYFLVFCDLIKSHVIFSIQIKGTKEMRFPLFVLLGFSFLFFACSSSKTKQAEISTFKCDLSAISFVEKSGEILGYGGFDIVQSDTVENAFLIIAQKMIDTKGLGKDRVTNYDQIRLRYSSVDSSVWVSHGVLSIDKGKKKFLAPQEKDKTRHNEVVKILLDRLFTQCNHGIFPNRP